VKDAEPVLVEAQEMFEPQTNAQIEDRPQQEKAEEVAKEKKIQELID
jgi:hypothetical protein